MSVSDLVEKDGGTMKSMTQLMLDLAYTCHVITHVTSNHNNCKAGGRPCHAPGIFHSFLSLLPTASKCQDILK